MGLNMLMRTSLKKMKQFWNDESGQSTTEYILILAAVVLIALKFKQNIGDRIKTATDRIGEKINEGVSDLGE
jgi:Flp pilus assembly pilin Flp